MPLFSSSPRPKTTPIQQPWKASLPQDATSITPLSSRERTAYHAGEQRLQQPRATSMIAGLSCLALLSGCMATGEQYAGNVYSAEQVNQQQDAKTVKILAVLPSKIKVDNAQGKQQAEVFGGILGALGGAAAGHGLSNNRPQGTLIGAVGGAGVGAAAGSLVPDKILVEGVSLTYVYQGKTLHSAQVGRQCEFVPGTAIVIATTAHETRVQPNATCPETAEKAGV